MGLEAFWTTIGHPHHGDPMPLVIDPTGYEVKALRRSASWRGKRVLEVGCGEGRLTLRLASLGPKRIDAIDTDRARVRVASQHLPSRFRNVIHYEVGQAERMKYPEASFDIVVLSWSL